MTVGELLDILLKYPRGYEISYNAYAAYLALYLQDITDKDGDNDVVIIVPNKNDN